MTRTEIVRAFILDNLTVFHDKTKVVLADDDNIFEKGFVDSMLALKLVTFLERTFGVEVTNDDLDLRTFSSVANIVRFIERKVGT